MRIVLSPKNFALLVRQTPAWVVLCVSLLATLWAWMFVSKHEESRSRAMFDREAQSVTEVVGDKLNEASVLIGGVRGLYSASQKVDQDEWQAYLDSVIGPDEKQRYGIQDIVFVAAVPGEQAKAFQEQARSEVSADYSIVPEGDRPEYFPILYAGHANHEDNFQEGSDLRVHQQVRELLESARDNGRVTMTARCVFRAPDGDVEDHPPHVLWAMPVYVNGLPTANVTQRREGLLGWVVSAVYLNDLLSKVPQDLILKTAFSVRDGDDLIYQWRPDGAEGMASRGEAAAGLFESQSRVHFGGRDWTLGFSASPRAYVQQTIRSGALVLAGGTVMSLLLFVTVWSLGVTQDRAASLASAMTTDLTRANEALKTQITERQQTEAELRRGEQKFRTLVKNVPGTIYRCLCDPDWTMHFISDSVTELTGFPASDFIQNTARTFASVIHPEDRQGVERDILRAVGDKLPYQLEYRVVHRDGAVHWVQERGQGIFDDNGRLLWLDGVIMDITARREAQQQLQEAKEAAEAANYSKSQFLANISHEIRTPLNGITGACELFAKTPLTNDQRQLMGIAKSSVEALLGTINQVLDYSKMENGMVELESIDFDLQSVVERVCDVVGFAAHNKGLELTYWIDPVLPRWFRGDPLRLGQVLTNLINNAVKFTPHGEVMVRVEYEAEMGDRQQMIRCEVRDTGMGVPQDRIDRLFKPFSQADTSTTRKFGGTGLGLAICAKIVSLMGGDIGVDSREGRGTTFWFTAMIEKTPDADRQSDQPPPLWRGQRVLVVDDNTNARNTLASYFTAWGMEVVPADTGRHALTLLEQAAGEGSVFHYLVIDQDMPEMDGVSLARAARAIPVFRDTALLLATKVSSQISQDILRGLRANALAKPVSPAKLIDGMRRSASHGGVADVLGESPGEDRAPAVVDDQPHGDVKILLADDHEINQTVIRAILQHTGYTCDVVGNGHSAVEACGQGGYDLILMDCQMPEMDGFEATRAIRAVEYSLIEQRRPGRRTPIIALTANDGAGIQRACLDAGMDRFLSKPVATEALLQTIREVLAGVPEAREPSQEQTRPSPSTGVLRRPSPEPPVTDNQQGGEPIEVRELFERCLQDARFVEEVLDQFKHSVVESVAAIEKSHADGDVKTLRTLSHSLKGAAGTVSAKRLQAVATQIQRLAENADLKTAEEAIAQLRHETEACLEFISRTPRITQGASPVDSQRGGETT